MMEVHLPGAMVLKLVLPRMEEDLLQLLQEEDTDYPHSEHHSHNKIVDFVRKILHKAIHLHHNIVDLERTIPQDLLLVR